ncbi:BBE domain-containing protein [Haladaptatus sp. YSMS36]|uniref:BBE domain-containing protein n=1 Tax=unclassified Haladaptatus TaxID=2622732 RepID=UPI0034E97B4F
MGGSRRPNEREVTSPQEIGAFVRRWSVCPASNYDRLVALKNEWDPDNRFRMNQNISPTV